jgi:hypothetical protein
MTHSTSSITLAWGKKLQASHHKILVKVVLHRSIRACANFASQLAQHMLVKLRQGLGWMPVGSVAYSALRCGVGGEIVRCLMHHDEGPLHDMITHICGLRTVRRSVLRAGTLGAGPVPIGDALQLSHEAMDVVLALESITANNGVIVRAIVAHNAHVGLVLQGYHNSIERVDARGVRL